MSIPSAKVSVVIPSHNYARFLTEAIDSVLAQTHPAHEILVVDDSSTDDTPDLVKGYGDRVSYLRVEKRGAYGARNDSLPHLSGDYFLNLDADNRLKPDMIESALDVILQAPAATGYVYTQRAYIGNGSGISTFPDFDPGRLLLQNYVDMGALIRMPLVQRYRFDESFNRGCGDHAFFLKLLSQKFHGVLLNRPLLEYRIHGDSITGNVNRKYHQLAICRQLIAAFPELYDSDTRKLSLAAARNRTLVAIIANRQPGASFPQRLQDLLTFIRVNPRHAEVINQFRYLVHPAASGETHPETF